MTQTPCVVDTNVGIVANGDSDMSPCCQLTCSQRLKEITDHGHIVIDDQWRMIKEYQNKMHASGEPGVGDAFLKWVLSNQKNPKRCTRVSITPKAENQQDFEEFPDHSTLQSFDPSDRKFVAVACAYPGEKKPNILQASDSKWWGWQEALSQLSIVVHFLCEKEIAKKHQQKIGTL